ncbi:MAG: hypothetical protein PHU66_09180, partial [Bacteroidaceae bacterium]|nr:hypothetical protein [Bacteroidaceae bacterium]
MPGIFSQYDAQDLNRLAAKGILEKLRNIRQRINVDFTARRLLWELIQNAKDNATTCNIHGNSKVKIEIEIEPNLLSFSHNNGYFTNENIRGLIRRYSSSEKDREVDTSALPPSTTGRFGTGFMTTHILSEKVYVNGFFQENETSYRKFELPLDRTGQTEKEIIQSVEIAFNVIEESINKSEKFDISASQHFKTQFKYSLNDEGYELAKISISEFDDCVAYTLINIPNIERVSVKQNDVFRFYEINKIAEYQTVDYLIEILEVKTNNHNSTQKHFATILDDNTRIIIPIKYSSDKIEIQILDKNVPRLFLDFPMIGTEDLNIPFVINNPLFEPTEPRDGVSLTGGNDKDTLINSSIFTKAFELFKAFIDYSSCQSSWSNLYNLARIKKPKERVWLNQEWYSKSLIAPIRQYLLVTPIVDIVGGGRIPIVKDGASVDFPYHSKKEIREGIWDLCNLDEYFILPLKEHIHEWYEIIWDKEYCLDIETIISWASAQLNIDGLQEKLKQKEIIPINWLNNLYKIISKDENVILTITQNKVKIIPNQLGVFCFLKDLSIDDNIEEHLKEILTILNDDIRIKLCYQGVNTLNSESNEHFWFFPSKTNQEFVVEHINKILKDGKNDNISKACDYLISLFSADKDFAKEKRETIFEFCKTVFPEDHNERREISALSDNIWIEADKLEIKWIINSIAEDKNIESSFQKLQFSDSDKFLKWLNKFISFLFSNDFSNLVNQKTNPILPNQNGLYCIKDDLFLDDGNIDESLKDIANELGYNVRGELLAKEIFLELPENRVRNQEQIAKEISKLIKPVLRDVNEREEKKDVIRKLYLWMNKNRIVAEQIFGEIYEKRFLLISDDEITANIEKAEILDEILNETGLTIDEAKSKIKSFLINEINSILPATIYENINKLLLEKNISIEQLESLIDMFDGDIEGLIGQGSSNDINKKAQYEENEKARELVMQKLTNEGYIFTQGIGQNSVVNGVYKNDVEYPLVVKSYKNSSYKFNIKPYEWLQLSKPNAMFWVHRGGGNLE